MSGWFDLADKQSGPRAVFHHSEGRGFPLSEQESPRCRCCNRFAPPPTPSPARSTCRLLLTIRETDYSVTPIAPGPDNVKAYRLEKLSGDRETYDLAHTNDGLVICDCERTGLARGDVSRVSMGRHWSSWGCCPGRAAWRT